MQQAMGAKIKQYTNFEGTILNNPIKLLKTIEEIFLNYEETKHPMQTLIKALKHLLRLKQYQGEDLDDYI